MASRHPNARDVQPRRVCPHRIRVSGRNVPQLKDPFPPFPGRAGRPTLCAKRALGVLACGGVSQSADDIPAPTRTAAVKEVPPPPSHTYL